MGPLSTAARSAPRVARSTMQRRALSDIAITRTGKPIIRGQGGRSVVFPPSTSLADSLFAAPPLAAIPSRSLAQLAPSDDTLSTD